MRLRTNRWRADRPLYGLKPFSNTIATDINDLPGNQLARTTTTGTLPAGAGTPSAWHLQTSYRTATRASPAHRAELVTCWSVPRAPNHAKTLLGGSLALLSAEAVG